MTEKCYKVQFTAHLHKLTLALKMLCNIEVIWKRGQKICESGKFPLEGGTAVFDKNISICCNMLYDPKTKIFKQKKTKFSILLSRNNETKQAGQIIFDVSQYINQRQLNKKDFQLKLANCPDKNAKLSFTICGVFKEEVSTDNISHKSQITNLKNNEQIQGITNSMIIPTAKDNKIITPTNQNGSGLQDKSPKDEQKLVKIQQQNQKMKSQMKKIEKLKKENEQLRKKIKQQDFKKVKEVKQKMQKLRQEIQKMKGQIKANKNLEKQTKTVQEDILKCKVKIMKALNFCADFGGSTLLNSVQQYCGMLQK